MATPMGEEVPAAASRIGSGKDDAEVGATSPAHSDSDLSDSDDDQEAGTDEARLQAAEEALKERPDDYEAHAKYIRCLRKSGNIKKLRAARERMSIDFPLTPKMWRQWAWDEISFSTSDEAFGDIEKLFERGVQEYLSVNLWRDYLYFVADAEYDRSISPCAPASLAKMRNLFECAIAAGGLHVTEGSKLWEAYRKFEMAILIIIVDGNIEEKAEQVERIRTLFHRQLSVPLADMESTLAEYKSWEAEQGNENDRGSDFDGVPSDIISAYKRANDMYNARMQYEDQLSNTSASEDEKEHEFLKYIKFEESKGDSARIQVLYERAVSDLPKSIDLWIEYTIYLDRSVKTPSVLKNVYDRATRNCPWGSMLWGMYLLSLERIHASEEELKRIFEQALKCSFETKEEYLYIYLFRVDRLRRQMPYGLDFQLIRQTFMDAADFLSPKLGAERLLLLHLYWAKLERNLGNDLAAARKVWEDALKESGSVLEFWQHYISMEIEMGNINEARSLYKRCYNRRFAGSGSEVICNAWMTFEREYGTLDDFDLALKETSALNEPSSFEVQQKADTDLYSASSDPSSANDFSHKRKASKMTNNQEHPTKRRKENAPKSTVPSIDQGPKAQIERTDALKAKKSNTVGQSHDLSTPTPPPSFGRRVTGHEEGLETSKAEESLCLEREKLQLERERLESQRQKEEERIMSIDLNKCSDRLRMYYQSRQEEIMERIQARRHGGM